MNLKQAAFNSAPLVTTGLGAAAGYFAAQEVARHVASEGLKQAVPVAGPVLGAIAGAYGGTLLREKLNAKWGSEPYVKVTKGKTTIGRLPVGDMTVEEIVRQFEKGLTSVNVEGVSGADVARLEDRIHEMEGAIGMAEEFMATIGDPNALMQLGAQINQALRGGAGDRRPPGDEYAAGHTFRGGSPHGAVRYG